MVFFLQLRGDPMNSQTAERIEMSTKTRAFFLARENEAKSQGCGGILIGFVHGGAHT